MKKQLLLAVLPALLVLSACNGGGQVKEKYDDLLEDTLAHEEIFDQQEQGLAPRRLLGPNVGGLRFEDPTPQTEKEEVGTPYIGVQSIVSGNTVSFRFVAAVQFTNANQRELATATWTRTVSKADGTAYPKDTTAPTPACTTAYKKLSNGGSALTIEAFNAAHNNSTYTHFVVYTLRNINLDTYAGSDYYVSAYLSIGGLGGDPLVSKAIAIRFDRAEKYTYVAADGLYYLEGSFSGVSKKFDPSAIRTTNNLAEFEYIDFSENDTFVIKEFHNSKFYFHGAQESLVYDGNQKITSCFEAGENNFIKVKSSMGGSYGLYLSRNSSRLYTEGDAPYNVGSGFYVRGDSASGWNNPSDTYQFIKTRSNVGELSNVYLKVGQFKIGNYDSYDNEWGYYGYRRTGYSGYDWHNCVIGNAAGNFGPGDGQNGQTCNIKCNVAGYYDIYITNNNYVSFEVHSA